MGSKIKSVVVSTTGELSAEDLAKKMMEGGGNTTPMEESAVGFTGEVRSDLDAITGGRVARTQLELLIEKKCGAKPSDVYIVLTSTTSSKRGFHAVMMAVVRGTDIHLGHTLIGAANVSENCPCPAVFKLNASGPLASTFDDGGKSTIQIWGANKNWLTEVGDYDRDANNSVGRIFDRVNVAFRNTKDQTAMGTGGREVTPADALTAAMSAFLLLSASSKRLAKSVPSAFKLGDVHDFNDAIWALHAKKDGATLSKLSAGLISLVNAENVALIGYTRSEVAVINRIAAALDAVVPGFAS